MVEAKVVPIKINKLVEKNEISTFILVFVMSKL